MFNGKKIRDYLNSFSKIITVAWLIIWCETIIFSQVATIFNFGDVNAIMYINDNVVQIGLIICGFYFCTKTVENVAQGYEEFTKVTKYAQQATEIFPEQDEFVEDEI